MKASPSVETRPFRELCADHGLTATHQRQVLYEVMQTMPGHPSPEEVYARVKKRIPQSPSRRFTKTFISSSREAY